jgi:phage-related tail protein
MNHHFIVDIGLAFSASGAGLLFTLRAGRAAAAFVLAGATWPALHALLHMFEWLGHGVPPDPGAAATEGLGDIVVGLIGLAVAARQFAIKESSNAEIALSSEGRQNGAGFRL